MSNNVNRTARKLEEQSHLHSDWHLQQHLDAKHNRAVFEQTMGVIGVVITLVILVALANGYTF